MATTIDLTVIKAQRVATQDAINADLAAAKADLDLAQETYILRINKLKTLNKELVVIDKLISENP